VITVDPTSRAAGVIGIEKAVSEETPVWFDAGRTTVRPFTGQWWKLRRRVFADAVRETDGIIVTSPKVFEYFRDIGLFTDDTAEKFTVMGHPTDTDVFSPPEDDRSNSDGGLEVLTISRLVPEKGLYYLLEAMDPILTNRDDVTLTILGKGPMKPVLQREIRDRGIADSITLKRTVPHSQIPSLLQGADVFANHAVDIARWEEFFGAVNIEAMACELPCIVSDSGSIPYVARVPDGVELVAQRDVVALRESLQKLIDSPELRTQMGQTARSFVEDEYSITAIGEKYHRMLQNGLESSPETPNQSK
jgi:glycosyltransferase involved in cell wall biosynthesis